MGIMVQLKFQVLDSRDHRLQHHNCYCYCTVIMIEITLLVVIAAVALSQLGMQLIDESSLICENDVTLELNWVENSLLRQVTIEFPLQLAFRSIYPSIPLQVYHDFYQHSQHFLLQLLFLWVILIRNLTQFHATFISYSYDLHHLSLHYQTMDCCCCCCW